jgi:multiple sugar transport system substrate-binding protein
MRVHRLLSDSILIRCPRPAVAFAAAVLMCAAGAACAQDVLRIWTRSSNDGRKTYDQIGAAFTQKTGIKIEYFNAITDFEQRLARAATGDDLPDLIINELGTMGQMVAMGIAQEIDKKSIATAGDLHDRAWRAATMPNGKIYGVPTSVQTHVLFIRKDWRTKLGLPVPQTWEDVAQLAKAFTEKDPDGNGRADTYGLGLPGGTSRGYVAWHLSSFLFQAGGEFMRVGPDGRIKSALHEPAATQTLSFFKRLVCDDKSTQPNAVNADTQQVNKSFTSGQVGIYLSGPYHISLFDREPGRDKIEVVPAPSGPGGQRASLASGEVAFISKKSQRKAQAIKFIEFLTSVEGQTLGMKAPADGLPVVRLPVNKNVDASSIYQDPRWTMVAQEYARHGRPLPQAENWSRLQQVTADGFNAILARCSTDIAAQLKTVSASLDAELAKQQASAR